MDKEIQILSRLAANHLHLAQFEPLRAVLLALRARNPDVALAVLQTIVARSGRFENILWSPSCPSPPLLTYLSTLELFQFDNASSAWGFDPETLRLRAEFLLLVQHLIDRVSESLRKNFDFESIEKDALIESEGLEERAEVLDKGEDLRDADGELDDCVRVLDKVLELGVKRLVPDVGGDNIDRTESRVSSDAVSIEEGNFVCLRKVILDYADVFDALCWNIQRQVRGWEVYDSGFTFTVQRDENASREDLLVEEEEQEELKVLGLIQRIVQLAHLNAMKECMKEGDVEAAVRLIRFLHFDYGVEEAEYRYVCLNF
jgi:zinc finger FYVE domain-containing protein 26